MKDEHFAKQEHTQPRSFPFADLRSEGNKQRLDVGPARSRLPPQRRDASSSTVTAVRSRLGSVSADERLLGRPLQPAQHRRSVGGIGANPTFVNRVNRESVEVVPSLSPTPLDHDQPGVLKDLKVLHDGAPVEFRYELAQRAGRAGAGLQRIENPPPGAVAQRLEQGVVFVVR